MIQNKQDCSGCGACRAVCPTKAIEMKSDQLGFLYPYANEKCIKCKKCLNICPIETNDIINNEKQNAFIAITRSQKELSLCSSGGAYMGLVNAFFGNEAGFLYVPIYDNTFKLKHNEFIVNKDDISSTRRSKYIQSDFTSVYEKVLNRLQNGDKVMIVGTPCQISGIKSYLSKDYDNLLLVDLLCTGVGSPRIFGEHIRLLESLRGKRVISYDMRNKGKDKYGNISTMQYKIGYSDSTYEKNSFYLDMYRKIFGKRLYLRRSCYDCKYKQPNRIGDITIGDWWGIYKKHIEVSKGASVIVFNNSKASKLIEKLKDFMVLTDIDYKYIIEEQPALRRVVINNNTTSSQKISSRTIRIILYKNSIFPLRQFIKSVLPSKCICFFRKIIKR